VQALISLAAELFPANLGREYEARRFHGDRKKAQESTLPTPRALEASTSERYLGAKRSERARVDNLCEETQNEAANPDPLTTRLECLKLVISVIAVEISGVVRSLTIGGRPGRVRSAQAPDLRHSIIILPNPELTEITEPISGFGFHHCFA
jgi:hypothetical protein